MHIIANDNISVSDRLGDEDSNATATRYSMDIDAKAEGLGFCR